jgi:hypothetical protein
MLVSGDKDERGGDCQSQISVSGDGSGVQVELPLALALATYAVGGWYKGGVGVCYH